MCAFICTCMVYLWIDGRIKNITYISKKTDQYNTFNILNTPLILIGMELKMTAILRAFETNRTCICGHLLYNAYNIHFDL